MIASVTWMSASAVHNWVITADTVPIAHTDAQLVWLVISSQLQDNLTWSNTLTCIRMHCEHSWLNWTTACGSSWAFTEIPRKVQRPSGLPGSRPNMYARPASAVDPRNYITMYKPYTFNQS
ncbi:TPA: hypothetical protein ACH3X1_007007 [Trebouxia sp. C0004]